MRYRAVVLPVSMILVAALMLARPRVAHATDALPQLTAATLEQWMSTLSNWGRWGEADDSARSI